MTDVIETHLLTRRFGRQLAVDSIDLRVPQGRVYGFVGPNGAGKTTTIRLLLGLLRPNEGEVLLFNRSMGRDRTKTLGRIGSLVEQPSLYPNLTGRENLEVIRHLRGLDGGEIDRALEVVRMKAEAGRLVRHYSTGMRQRLGLAVALLGRPELLILDEPTNGLDPAGIHEMRGFLARLAEQEGITVFLSSHLINEVEQTATHIGIIEKGRLLFQGSLEALQSRLSQAIVLQVDRPDAAQQLLQQAGWQVTPAADGQLSVAAHERADAALINRQLTEQSFEVYQLAIERRSLEDIFLEITNHQAES